VTNPPPIPNDSPSIWDMVIQDMHARAELGKQRYGTPLQVGNGRDHLQDAYEEALDLAVYLKGEMESRKVARNPLAELEAWEYAHKARAALIEIDNGYGATCWSVTLHGEGKRRVIAAECAFVEGTPKTDVVFVSTDESEDPFVGLGPVILAAIDQWNRPVQEASP
jgi:hypothetical protein